MARSVGGPVGSDTFGMMRLLGSSYLVKYTRGEPNRTGFSDPTHSGAASSARWRADSSPIGTERILRKDQALPWILEFPAVENLG